MSGEPGTISLESIHLFNNQSLYAREWANFVKAGTGGSSFYLIHAGDGKYIFEYTIAHGPYNEGKGRRVRAHNDGNPFVSYPDSVTAHYESTLYTFQLV